MEKKRVGIIVTLIEFGKVKIFVAVQLCFELEKSQLINICQIYNCDIYLENNREITIQTFIRQNLLLFTTSIPMTITIVTCVKQGSNI